MSHRDALPESVSLPGDGLMLAGDAYGDAQAPPVLFFHGGGQSRRSWRGAARAVGEAGYRGVSIDLRGHGESDWSPSGDYPVAAFGRDVESLVKHFGRRVALVGASRGGQSALIGGSRHPHDVALVMLADVAPMIDDSGVEEIRGFFRASADGFASVEEAADALHDHLGQPRVADPSGLRKALRTDGGRLFWQWDPMTCAPEFLHPPEEEDALVEAARRIACPVVLVRAELSSIVSDQSVALFRQLAPQLEVETAHGVGHMFTGDQNDAFARSLLRHLALRLPLA